MSHEYASHVASVIVNGVFLLDCNRGDRVKYEGSHFYKDGNESVNRRSSFQETNCHRTQIQYLRMILDRVCSETVVFHFFQTSI